MSWELTAGLQNLRNQVNDRFGHRDKASDGTIGDPAHQARTSGHNPDDTAGARPSWNGDPDSVPEVRAWDMDSDLGDPKIRAQDLVDHIRALPGVDQVLRYMIWNERIYHSRNGWHPEPAEGHTEHVHFEGAWSQAADNNTTFDYRLDQLGEPDMALTDDLIPLTADTAKEIGKAAGEKMPAATLLQLAVIHGARANRGTAAVTKDVEEVKAEVSDLAAEVAALKTGPAGVDLDQLADKILDRLIARATAPH